MQNVSQSQKGLLSFTIAMIASVLSISGTLMTQFAVIVWAWQSTGSTTATGLVTVLAFLSVVTVSIFSGALIDRWNRKKAIIVTDAIGAMTTGLILLLHLTNSLQVWHLAILGVMMGVLEAFQFPAYLASITQMVPQEQRSRANGMFQSSWSVAEIVAGALGGILFAAIGLTGVLIIDLLTFAIIITTISLIRIPQPERTESEQCSLVQDILEGFRYLLTSSNVLWTVLIFTSVDVAFGAYEGLFRPMVLVLTGNNERILGLALAAVSVGSVVGGGLMTLWKGPKNRIPMILLCWSVMSVFGFIIAGLGRALPIWLIGRFFAGVIGTIAVVLSFAIWQDKVEESIQGRVFSIIRLVVQISIPISAFVTILLADHMVRPAMQPGQPLANILGWLFGTGSGAAMSLILVTTGAIFGVIVPLLGFLIPAIRNADKNPDQSQELVTPEPALAVASDQNAAM